MNRSMLLRHGDPRDMIGPMRPEPQTNEILMPSEVPAEFFNELMNIGNLQDNWIPGMETPVQDPTNYGPVEDRFGMGERFGF